MDDEEYKKMPIDERCVHKLWKARVNGYEEVAKLFRQIDDEKSPEFSKYLGLVKKFVVDSNAVGQEKGLEATFAYIENYAHAGKTVGEVMPGIISKCIAAPKARTKELAVQITLMYIEIEKGEAVQEELIKGMEQKNPKIVAACVNTSTIALKEFGTKIISVKPLLKKIGALLSDRDKAVRDESKLMIVEMYRWIGAALRPQLQAANLQPVQLTELEAEFSKVDGQKPVPSRYIRSQQVKQAKMAAEVAEDQGEEEGDNNDTPQEIDQLDLADPVEILSKLPKDFYEKIEAKKWQERKEALEIVESLVKTPKLENGDYGELVRALKKVIQKDSNVVCVAIAGRCIAGLANGLRKKFGQYATFCVSALLEKFKEKKQNVVNALREAIDAVYLTTTLEANLEDILEAMNNKNPCVKSETCFFLARAFTKTSPASINKKLLKALTTNLIKNINESDPSVREASAEALGTLMKLVGEKAIGPFCVELEKDNLKMAKVKEFCEKAVITVKTSGVKKERPTTAPAKINESKPVDKPAPRKVAAPKKKNEISSGSATIVRSKGQKGTAKPSSLNIEKELADDEVDDIVANVLSASIVGEISSSNWKERLAAAEQVLSQIQAMDSKNVPTQAIVKFLAKKPGLKDTNFQVLKAKLEILKYLAENCKFSMTTANCCVIDISEKFSDSKNGTAVAETLTAIAEANTLGQITDIVLDFAFTQKSPKVQQEALIWLSGALKEFGLSNLNIKFIIDISKKALSSTNPGVRQAVITFLGTLYLYVGASLNIFFENEKAAIRDLINAECDKYEGNKPPIPTKGLLKTPDTGSSECLDVAEEPAEQEAINIQDHLPRVDISSQITEVILNELSDKNWKVRNEALTKISTILQEAKFIKPNLGDLPQALAVRLTDSNVKIAQSVLNICEAITKSMGPSCRQYIKVFLPGILQNLGDSKAILRTAALETINCFAEQCGYKEFFENEMIGDALKSGSPLLRIELWNWLSENLPKIPPKGIPKEELLICVPHLFSNLEDRNAEVRKNAQEAILGIMIHLGYDAMLKQTEKLKPGSKTNITAALERVRPNLPVKALPKKPVEREDKAVRGTKPAANSKNAVRPKGTNVSKSAPTAVSKKKDEDIDFSPLLVVNNLKHQRTIDESKLKVLKWNFTQPRDEFVDLLKDQMTVANVNKTLMANMFHSDFRYHIKAIESLSDDLTGNSQALISNLDLILKWLTLRFFDTNPSVLLKGLEYLQSVFNMLIDSQYRMLDNEASAFIPYLVLKIGDPKDSVRNGVKALLNQISRLYPVSKLFTYVMEGVKSKNARQRAECLEVMSSIIEGYGIMVCMPTPNACLKEVAKQISDRDNSVRNAALNCVVQAYNIVGDKVYKLVGNICDKDMSLLEERIKRSSRKTIIPKSDIETTIIKAPISPQKESVSHNKNRSSNHSVNNDDDDYHDEDVDEEECLPPVILPSQVTHELPKEIDGPFKLDPEFMGELDNMKPSYPLANLANFDLVFLDESLRIPTKEEAKATVLATPAPSISFSETIRRSTIVPKMPSPKLQDPTIERLIRQMASSNLTSAMMGMTQLHELLPQLQGDIMLEYEEEFMMSVITQLKYLQAQDAATETSVAKAYRNILTVMDSFYHNKLLGKRLSQNILKELIFQLINILVEDKLGKIPNGDAYVRVINLHCVKIIEKSDHTIIICTLIKLINECISNDCSPRHVDLVMKCLWRIIKLIPVWGEELDYDLILVEIHNFLKKFPSIWWKSKEIDTPLRTVKTVLHSCAKIKGASLLLHLKKIPNTSESEVESFIVRILKSLRMTDTQQPPKPESQRMPLSRANHSTLTDIFQKIGSKEDTKEGLNLLYDFLQEQPEADIEPFLIKSSKFFQDYIKNGLKDIKESRKTTIIEKVGDTNEVPLKESSPSDNSDYWKQKLSVWNKQFDEVKPDRKSTIITE